MPAKKSTARKRSVKAVARVDIVSGQTVRCPNCNCGMQKMSENRDGKGKLINTQYVCGCLGGVTYYNVHAGQSGRAN
jgi:hypothetical protein